MKYTQLTEQLRDNGFIIMQKIESKEKALEVVSKLLNISVNSLSIGWLQVRTNGAERPSDTPSDIPFHQENYYLDNRPRYLALWCAASGQEEENTLLVNNNEILKHLDSEILSHLSKCYIRFNRIRGETSKYYPLIENIDNFKSIRYAIHDSRFRFVEISDTPDNTSNTLIQNQLESAIFKAKQKRVSWTKGKLLLFDNMKFLHGRTHLLKESSRILLRITAYTKEVK